MATRSLIVTQAEDGKFHGIYCHNDGYLRGVGKKLAHHYTDPEKVKKLIALGDISSLRKEVDATPGHCWQTPDRDVTIAYGRDRGETGTEPTVRATLEGVAEYIYDHAYLYLFQDGRWFYRYRHDKEPGLKPLELAEEINHG